MRVAIIACKNQKQNYRCSVDEMYSKSNLYNAQKEYIKKGYDDYYVMSFHIGIKHHTDIIDPYELCMSYAGKKAKGYTITKPAPEKVKWVNEQLKEMIDKGWEIDIHTSKAYYNFLTKENQTKINYIRQYYPKEQAKRYRKLALLLDSKPLDEVNEMVSYQPNKSPEQPQTYYHPIHGEFSGTSSQLATTYNLNNGNCYQLAIGYKGKVMNVGWVKDKTLLDKLYQTKSGQWRLKK